MQLVDGSRVAIVGGGPAGSFTALHLMRFAAQANLRFHITIFEPRDFSQAGPQGCNKCAGILSSMLVKNLSILGLTLPPEIIQAKLSSYILHLQGSELHIEQPDSERHIISVYRGSGPRLGTAPYPRSFDGWLLEQAKGRGATLRPERVVAVRPGLPHTIITAHEEFKADVVFLAVGINSRIQLDAGWGYRPPLFEVMAQNEIPLPATLLDDQVHIFFGPPAGLIFGGLIPKGKYASVSLLGHKLPPKAVAEALKSHALFTSSSEDIPMLCGCTPRVAVSSAKGYYADGMAAVGDAAVTRLYKDGIGAAFLTAEAAARTAVERGVQASDFAAGYRPTCCKIAVDNFYGRLLFGLWGFIGHFPALVATWQKVVLQENDLPVKQQIYRRMLWGMFTGDESYRQIFWLLVRHASLPMIWGTLRNWRQK